MSSSHRFRYDDRWLPPAPVVSVRLARDAAEPHFGFDALIDSGADASVISPSVVRQLQLVPVKEARLTAFSDAVEVGARVAVHQFHLVMPDGVGSGNLEALEHEFIAGQEYIILGRDVMNMWRVTLDGPGLAGEIFSQG